MRSRALGAEAPAARASSPASTAQRNALAMATGLSALAMAVLTSTASAPISIASVAWDGMPSPASTTTGTVACSMVDEGYDVRPADNTSVNSFRAAWVSSTTKMAPLPIMVMEFPRWLAG
jgi:hypothetical protein